VIHREELYEILTDVLMQERADDQAARAVVDATAQQQRQRSRRVILEALSNARCIQPGAEQDRRCVDCTGRDNDMVRVDRGAVDKVHTRDSAA